MRFAAICSSCGKSTELNFSPTEGRPIYCRECLAKIKSGEMQPVRAGRVTVPKEEKKYLSDLAGLGIEFEIPKEEREREAVAESPHSGFGAKIPRGYVEVPAVGGAAEKPMSLSDLKPSERDKEKEKAREKEKEAKPQRKHIDIDIDDLRKAIQESLKEDLKSEDHAEIPKEENPL